MSVITSSRAPLFFALALLAPALAFAASWPSSGTATIPAGETWDITSSDVSKVDNLTKIVFADATSKVTYNLSSAWTMKTPLSGPGTMSFTGAGAITITADNSALTGSFYFNNTAVVVAHARGLGGASAQTCHFWAGSSGRSMTFGNATASVLTNGVPVQIHAASYCQSDANAATFGPTASGKTLVQNADFSFVGNSHCYICHYYNVYFLKAYDCSVGYIHWKFTSGGDVRLLGTMNASATLVYVPSGASLHLGLSSVSLTGNFLSYSAKYVCDHADTFPPTVWVYDSNYSSTCNLNGYDQTINRIAGYGSNSGASSTAGNPLMSFSSASPAAWIVTGTYGWNINPQFTGAAGFTMAGTGTYGFYNTSGKVSNDTTGKLWVKSGTVVLADNYAWTGNDLVVEGTGTLDCRSTESFNGPRADAVIRGSGVLKVPDGGLLQFSSLTVDGTAIPERETAYSVSELQAMGCGAHITGDGRVSVTPCAAEWTGWPTNAGEKVSIPARVTVTVKTADDLKNALACSEINVQGAATVDFQYIKGSTDILWVTNRFSGRGTVQFSSIPKIYMDSDASAMLDTGHVAFSLCDSVIVSNAVALGGLDSGACRFVSNSSKCRSLLFAGTGEIHNRAAILFDYRTEFGAESADARLFQDNSFQGKTYVASDSGAAYFKNKITFTAGDVGSASANALFFSGYEATDVRLASGARLYSTGPIYLWLKGAWHLANGSNTLSELHVALDAGQSVSCEAENTFSNAVLVAYDYAKGLFDLGGFSQEASYCRMQTAPSAPTTATGHLCVTSGAPAQIVATSTAGTVRDPIYWHFSGQSGFWLKGGDHVTLSRQQSTSTGELRVSAGKLTLNRNASWAGSVVVDGTGTFVIDATAGGKYLTTSETEVPALAADSRVEIHGDGKIAIGQPLAIHSITIDGEEAYLEPGVWGSSGAFKAGLIDAAHVRDDLFDADSAGTFTVRHNPSPRGFLIITR